MSLGKWWIAVVGLIHLAIARITYGIALSDNWNRYEKMNPDVPQIGFRELVCTSIHKVLDFPLTYAALKWTKSNKVIVASYLVNSLLWATIFYFLFIWITQSRRRG